jgi:hypothetical protein
MNNMNDDEQKYSESVTVASITMHTAILDSTAILFTKIINVE